MSRRAFPSLPLPKQFSIGNPMIESLTMHAYEIGVIDCVEIYTKELVKAGVHQAPQVAKLMLAKLQLPYGSSN